MKRNIETFNGFKSELKGILALFNDFKGEALLPLFEAVVNSIQSIEERFNDEMNKGKIVINIIRSEQEELPYEENVRAEPEIISFEIIDNGIGFIDDNLESFKTIGSSYKVNKGGKGFGRFTWLKAFESVQIHSIFQSGDKFQQRNLNFSLTLDKCLSITTAPSNSSSPETVVKLIGFKNVYKTAPTACKTGFKIAQRIMEHCLFYFISNKNPQIIINDKGANFSKKSYNLQELYGDIKDNMKADTLQVGKHSFNLYHLKLYDTTASMHKLVLCANNRDVKKIDMSKLLGTGIQFDDNNKKFSYAVYVSSKYLDAYVEPTRTEFHFPETSVSLRGEEFLGQNDIEKEITEKSKGFLKDYLARYEIAREEFVGDYVKKNPALRSVLHYCPEAILDIELNTSEERMDEILYAHKGKAEFKIKKNTAQLLNKSKNTIEEIDVAFEDAKTRINNIQKDNLANYMLFRKLMIDLLERKIELNKDKKFEKEEIIHDIIFPRKSTSDKINYNDHNLWMLDDRLAFHRYAASDLPLNQTIQIASKDRPDIIIFSDIDNITRNSRAISIIEFKRPQRNGYNESVTEQIIRTIVAIRESKCSSINGRPIIANNTTQFFCYAICDFTDKLKYIATNEEYTILPDGLGYYKYHKTRDAHFYLINYDKIVVDAQKRHYAFFEKLGILQA